MLVGECKAIYNGGNLIDKIYHGSDLVYPLQTEIKAINMTLLDAPSVNVKVATYGRKLESIMIRFTWGDNASVEDVTQPYAEGNLYVYKLAVEYPRIAQSLKIELLYEDTVIQSITDWSIQSYLEYVKESNPGNDVLIQLCTAFWNLGAYSTWYFLDGEDVSIPEVEAVTAEQIGDGYERNVEVQEVYVYYGASLNVNNYMNILFSFVEERMLDTYSVTITDNNGNVVDYPTPDIKGTLIRYRVNEIKPSMYNIGFDITITDADNQPVFVQRNYSVLTYCLAQINKTSASLKYKGFCKAMYLWHIAASNAEGIINDDSFCDMTL